MPRQLEAMKDVVACEKVGRGGKQPATPTCPNGETHGTCAVSHSFLNGRRTRGTETSKYPQEQKSNEIPEVAASEPGPALKQWDG